MDRDNSPKKLALYEERLVTLWERLVAMLGIHTTRVLLQRAIGQAAQCHPALDLIRHADSGLSMEALEESNAPWSQAEIEAAFSDLCAQLRLILARLLPQVLVIDDDEGIREVVAMALSAIGYEVVSVGDGAAALARLATVQPAVILLDMRMPTMDGWAFAQAYDHLPEPRAPVIVMTAAQDAAMCAAEINAATYLAKPFDLVDLRACIEQRANQG